METTDTKKKKYQVAMKFNGKEHQITTSDLKSAILSVKPNFLKTKVLFSVSEGNKICEHVLQPRRARMIFGREVYLDMFIKNLIFKSNG